MHDHLLTRVNHGTDTQTFVPFVPAMFHFTEQTQALDSVVFFGLFYMFVPCSLNIYIPTTGREHTLQCKPCGVGSIKRLSANVF
jgi:hypothetical protein